MGSGKREGSKEEVLWPQSCVYQVLTTLRSALGLPQHLGPFCAATDLSPPSITNLKHQVFLLLLQLLVLFALHLLLRQGGAVFQQLRSHGLEFGLMALGLFFLGSGKEDKKCLPRSDASYLRDEPQAFPFPKWQY